MPPLTTSPSTKKQLWNSLFQARFFSPGRPHDPPPYTPFGKFLNGNFVVPHKYDSLINSSNYHFLTTCRLQGDGKSLIKETALVCSELPCRPPSFLLAPFSPLKLGCMDPSEERSRRKRVPLFLKKVPQGTQLSLGSPSNVVAFVEKEIRLKHPLSVIDAYTVV